MKKIAPEVVSKYGDLQKRRAALEKEISELEDTYRDIACEYFADMCQGIFEENPLLQSFNWTQYTPSWNDGDTCYFSARTSNPYINEEDDENEGVELTDQQKKHLRSRVSKFLDQFKNADYENWFGEGVRVIVKRIGDGVEVITEEFYDHE
jgi:hypothetical protein